MITKKHVVKSTLNSLYKFLSTIVLNISSIYFRFINSSSLVSDEKQQKLNNTFNNNHLKDFC